jgi:hypothetical protein
MKLGESRRVPATTCLGCGKPLDGATAVVVDEDTSPDPGDLTVCIYCGHLMAFGDDLQLRELTPEEQVYIAGDKRILAVMRTRVAMGMTTEEEDDGIHGNQDSG